MVSFCSTSGGLSASAQLKKFRESLESSFNKKTLLKDGTTSNPSPSSSKPAPQAKTLQAKAPQAASSKPVASVVRKPQPQQPKKPQPPKQPQGAAVEVIDLDEDDVICID